MSSYSSFHYSWEEDKPVYDFHWNKRTFHPGNLAPSPNTANSRSCSGSGLAYVRAHVRAAPRGLSACPEQVWGLVGALGVVNWPLTCIQLICLLNRRFWIDSDAIFCLCLDYQIIPVCLLLAYCSHWDSPILGLWVLDRLGLSSPLLSWTITSFSLCSISSLAVPAS